MPASQLRSGVGQLTQLAARDLDAVWRQVTNAVQAKEALADILPSLVDAYGSAAATMAAEWYDDLRSKAAVRGSFEAIPAELGDTGAEALAGWGVGPLFAENPDWSSAQSLVLGGMQRRLANAARTTVTQSSIADPGADGWQRSASGGCDFCQMLAGRGSVYSEAGADFASHDHCQCVAVPAWSGHPRPVKAFTPSKRVASDADRARVRAYLRNH